MNRGKRFFAPEVIQTSSMDCGPAALKCLLEGFGIHASYGRLRETCQTDVDGTSIDTIEELAVDLGLDAEQVMVPAEHLLIPAARLLPALAVTHLPGGVTHFVVVWSSVAGFVQVMDPATGRHWTSSRSLTNELFRHALLVEAAAWEEWARTEDFLDPLRHRLLAVGVAEVTAGTLVAQTLEQPGWGPLATLDAALRFVAAMIAAGAALRGEESARLLRSTVAAQQAPGDGALPPEFWYVRPAPRPATDEEPGREQLVCTGAVLLRVRGRRGQERASAVGGPRLEAVLSDSPASALRDLASLVRPDGWTAPLVLASAIALGGVVAAAEAVVQRGLLEVGRQLVLPEQRLMASTAALAFFAILALMQFRLAEGAVALGRRLEVRLRIAFFEKLPRLRDRYFQSRLVSDMAERSHSAHAVRMMPELMAGFLRCTVEILVTASGIAWLDPPSAPLAFTAAVMAISVPLLFHPLLAERDLRFRTHTGALARFYLDALIGLAAVRSHGADHALRSLHARLLDSWAAAGVRLQRSAAAAEAAQSLVGFAFAVWLLVAYLGRGSEGAASLLLVYWALRLPVLAQDTMTVARQYPMRRSVTLRLMELIGRVGHDGPAEGEPARTTRRGVPVELAFESVCVKVAGHGVLHDIDFVVAPGEHVSLVGPSGAGKSTLAGLLLGWHEPVAGRVLVDGQPLTASTIQELRERTVWVDPEVTLWNTPLLDNLCYGLPPDQPWSVDGVIDRAHLAEVVERLPSGMQTRLGEGGRLLSGGEGQRVRFGRGLVRRDVALVILDEPFRGLERPRRRALLEAARRHWRGATLLCITHDIHETRDFDRVLVVEEGRVTEDGVPADLAASNHSRYRALLDAEASVQRSFTTGGWKRLRVEGGRVVPEESPRR